MSCHVLQHEHRRHACIAHHMHTGKPAALIIHGVPGFTYGHAVHASQTIFIKNMCLTLYQPKYENRKPECAEKDSHCHAQREQG